LVTNCETATSAQARKSSLSMSESYTKNLINWSGVACRVKVLFQVGFSVFLATLVLFLWTWWTFKSFVSNLWLITSTQTYGSLNPLLSAAGRFFPAATVTVTL